MGASGSGIRPSGRQRCATSGSRAGLGFYRSTNWHPDLHLKKYLSAWNSGLWMLRGGVG